MDRATKIEIAKMLIPLIGLWWVIARILPSIGPISWWDVSDKTFPILIALTAYQATWWGLLKYFNMLMT